MPKLAVLAAVVMALTAVGCTQTSPTAAQVPTATTNPSPTTAPSPLPTESPTATLLISLTPTPQPQPSATPTVRPTPTEAPTPTPAVTPPPTATTEPTVTPEPTKTPTFVPTATPFPTPPATATVVPTPNPTPTPTLTPTPDPFLELRSTLPWADGNLTADEETALSALSNLTVRAPALSSKLAAFAWLADDANEHEAQALRFMDYLASRDIELANLVAGLPWMEDDITESERYALQNIAAFAARDTPRAKIVVGLPWVTDDITVPEYNALGRLADIAGKDASLTASVISLSWLADDITDQERQSLYYLERVAQKDITLSKALAGMDFFTDSVEDHDIWALSSLLDLSTSDLAYLVGQDWFTDGLDDDEAAFVAVLGDLAKRSPQQFQGLVDTHYTRSTTVTLPLAGEVALIGFRPTPFKVFDPAMPLVEDSLQAMESFMNVPFPREEVIVLFVDLFEFNPINDFTVALHVGTHLLVTRPEIIQGDFRHILAHEVAHYYWQSGNAPLWFREGGANFLASYTLDWNDRRPLADRHLDLDAHGVRTCANRGVDSIQELLDLLQLQGYAKHQTTPSFLCNYVLGEFLLLKLYQTIGPDSTSAAWSELYLIWKSEGRAVTEEEIHQAFLRNTSMGQINDFHAVYDRWHGGVFPN